MQYAEVHCACTCSKLGPSLSKFGGSILSLLPGGREAINIVYHFVIIINMNVIELVCNYVVEKWQPHKALISAALTHIKAETSTLFIFT